MVKTVATALAVAFALQADDPNLKYLKERGFSIQKPPKKDEWQFKDKGHFARSQLVVMNVVDDVSIEMYSEGLDSDKVNYDPKYTLEQSWKLISANGEYKDAAMVGKIQSTTLPGRGAGGQKVFLLDMTMKINDAPMEWKQYCFVGHENRSGFIVNVVGKQGLYAKHKADLEYMLSTIKTYKIPKN